MMHPREPHAAPAPNRSEPRPTAFHAARRTRLALTISFFRKQHAQKRLQLDWLDHGQTPMATRRFTPQGLTFANGVLIFANSWRDTRSRVYELEMPSLRPRRSFDMPRPAVHTSGLAFTGYWLWAVDYISNRAYRIDLSASLASGRAVVDGWFDTGLNGTSACCIVPSQNAGLGRHGPTLLAISDFMNSSTTRFVDTEAALRDHHARHAVIFAYRNGGFSQGLEFCNGSLYESENRRGTNIINRIDILAAKTRQRASKAAIEQFNAPSTAVEDLAFDGSRLWTSDESAFRFFSTTLPT